MEAKFQHTYYKDYHRTKLLPERGIRLDKVEKKLPEFHARLTVTRWICFASKLFYTNKQWVREFYTNLNVFSLKKPMMIIWGKRVNFGAKQVNIVYGLLDANMGKFTARACEPRTWMANILCTGKVVSWSITKRDILIKDFTAKARLWLNIVYSRVLPCTHMNIVRFESLNGGFYPIWHLSQCG
ncbi:hypothetical protein FXO38_29990 [Capsicum annuum]|nr:hypothetical protein FXO38_29990 [Capsicum annuum]